MILSSRRDVGTNLVFTFLTRPFLLFDVEFFYNESFLCVLSANGHFHVKVVILTKDVDSHYDNNYEGTLLYNMS